MKEMVSVLWVPAEVLQLPGRKTLGLCGKTKRVFKVALNELEILIVNDIIINSTCEEGMRCLNVKCALNHSTAKSLKIKQKAFQELPIEDHWPELKNIEEKLCTKHSDGGLIVIKKIKGGK